MIKNKWIIIFINNVICFWKGHNVFLHCSLSGSVIFGVCERCKKYLLLQNQEWTEIDYEYFKDLEKWWSGGYREDFERSLN